MPDQRDIADMGGTMRLGIYPCRLVEGSKAFAAYGEALAFERHRHRFEFNNLYRKDLKEAGMLFSGQSPNGRLVEIAELSDHPFMLGSQFHPEFRSRPTRPHPLFSAFIRAAKDRAKAIRQIEGGERGVQRIVSDLSGLPSGAGQSQTLEVGSEASNF
jgi:CTP synthase